MTSHRARVRSLARSYRTGGGFVSDDLHATGSCTAICPACNGKGELPVHQGGMDAEGHVLWSEPSGEPVECYRCDGTGVIEA